MKEQTRASAVSLALYLMVAWGIASLAGNGSFWIVIGLLLGARFAYGLLEELAVFLAWTLWNRQATVAEFVKVLRTNALPQRHYPSEKLLSYVGNVFGNERLTLDQRVSALMIQAAVNSAGQHGIFAGSRALSAGEEALRIYSPGWKTPETVADDEE